MRHKKHYVDNDELRDEIIRHRQLMNESDTDVQISDSLGMMLCNIVENVGNKHRYRGYSYISDMKSSAVEILIRIVQKKRGVKFDPIKRKKVYSYLYSAVNKYFREYIDNAREYDYIQFHIETENLDIETVNQSKTEYIEHLEKLAEQARKYENYQRRKGVKNFNPNRKKK